jgi:pimeloyl-ACP methyl ester carboxylesterase
VGAVRAGRLELGYSAVGIGTHVILLHSGGLSSRQWGRFAEELAGGYRVVAPDFLGYGRSSRWPEDEEFHFILDALAIEALLDSIGEPVHLVGHSYGGFIALLVALHRPARVRSLAVFEPVAFGVLHSRHDAAGLSSLEAAGIENSLMDSRTGGQEPWLRAFVDYWSGEGAWDRLAEAARASFRAAGWKLFGEVRSLLLDRTPHQAYAMLSVPTLLLCGETSPIAARRVVALLAEAIPGARERTVAGAGHMGPLTHAAQVNGWIADHLARAASPGPYAPN